MYCAYSVHMHACISCRFGCQSCVRLGDPPLWTLHSYYLATVRENGSPTQGKARQSRTCIAWLPCASLMLLHLIATAHRCIVCVRKRKNRSVQNSRQTNTNCDVCVCVCVCVIFQVGAVHVPGPGCQGVPCSRGLGRRHAARSIVSSHRADGM